MHKYFLVWTRSALLSLQSHLQQRVGSLVFILGKFIRFGFFFMLIVLIGDRVSQVSGFSLHQMVIFFLLFNFFDMFGQVFYRGIYAFRQQIVSGEFDFGLVKPISPLFLALTRLTDPLDIPLLTIILFVLIKEFVTLPTQNQLAFLILAIGAFFIITAIHIFVAAFGIMTTEIDHTIMIYRDLSSMARFPTDIYSLPIRGFITFIIPITIAYTVPAKAFLGLLTPAVFIYSLVISLIFFWLSLKFWHYALTKYSSASS